MTKKMYRNEEMCEKIHKQPTEHIGGLEQQIVVTFRNGLIHQGREVVGEIDLTLFAPMIRTIYHAEEKSHDTKGQFQKMLKQDAQHKALFNTYFLNYNYERQVGLYLHDKKIIEVVR